MSDQSDRERIVALERAALVRWGNGDPHGYLEIMDSDVTYFDPYQAMRIDGLAAMKTMLEPFVGKIRVDRFELVNPQVQLGDDLAVLTFNLVNYLRQPDGAESVLNRWNSTEVYRRVDGSWKIAHSHWSYTTPTSG